LKEGSQGREEGRKESKERIVGRKELKEGRDRRGQHDDDDILENFEPIGGGEQGRNVMRN
jgi:hypothetical protein